MNIAADNATTITANAAKSSNSNRTMATASKSTAGSNDSPISTKHIPFRKIQDKVNNADCAIIDTANATNSGNSNGTMATASKSTAGSNDSPISTKHIPFRKIQDKVNNADCAIIDTANATNSGNSNGTMGDRGDGGKNGIGMNRVRKKVAELNKLRRLCRSPSYAVTEGLIHGFDSVKVVSDFIRFGKNPGTIDIYNADFLWRITGLADFDGLRTSLQRNGAKMISTHSRAGWKHQRSTWKFIDIEGETFGPGCDARNWIDSKVKAARKALEDAKNIASSRTDIGLYLAPISTSKQKGNKKDESSKKKSSSSSKSKKTLSSTLSSKKDESSKKKSSSSSKSKKKTLSSTSSSTSSSKSKKTLSSKKEAPGKKAPQQSIQSFYPVVKKQKSNKDEDDKTF
ncbi:hypothetical protein QTG54_006548 [Skeletonema marinoi]|uniref:Uncharacterized protein n=1 Tax=Skeletonema marinoi TaxID=267567 RepID=A0AAD8YCU8_9STRA|nr:hypothetical protein QTG54_006548 [Skeletonema marinoi]